MSPMCRRKLGQARSRTRGAALVELMIGITVGLLVLASALSASASLLQAAAAARDAADLQQRTDTVLRLIGRQVRQAGSVRVLPDVGGYRFSNEFSGWAQTGVAVSGIEGGPGKPDILRVSYEPESDEDRDALGYLPNKDKAGFDASKGDSILFHFDSQFLIAIDPSDSGRDALFARGARPRYALQPLVNGVDDLQLQYGIAAADGTLAYLDADMLVSGTPVLAVAACIQVSSDARHGATGALDCHGTPIPPTRHKGRLIRLARGIFRVNNAN